MGQREYRRNGLFAVKKHMKSTVMYPEYPGVSIIINMDRQSCNGLRKNSDTGVDCSHLYGTSFIGFHASSLYLS